MLSHNLSFIHNFNHNFMIPIKLFITLILFKTNKLYINASHKMGSKIPQTISHNHTGKITIQ